jgi:hypothetical protein
MYTPIADLIVKEIKWHEAHRGESGKGEEFEKAFIAGLEQARGLAKHFEEAQASVPFHVEECN